MGGNTQGATTFATTGGQSGVTGPTATPGATVGNQQLPTTPNGDNSNSPATLTTLQQQTLGLIKAVGVLREVSANTYQIPYALEVKNTAPVAVTNVQVVDNLLRTSTPWARWHNGSGDRPGGNCRF